jgi:GlpG protein
MREVASFQDEKAAKLFADVLCAREIDAEISRTRDGQFHVWVLEERHLETSRALWASFDANPAAPEFAAAAGSIDRKTRKTEVEERRSRHEIINVRKRWTTGSDRRGVLTLFLVVGSVGVTLLMTFGQQSLASSLFIGTPDEAVIGRPFWHVLHGEVWRLVTPIFMHFGVLHILFNMWWLLDIGSAIESRIGQFRYGALVLSTAILSNVAEYAWTGNPFFGGMSGVLYALFAYVWVRGRLDHTFGLQMPPATALILLVWLLLGFTGTIGNVANITHLAGLVAGAALGGLAAGIRRV